MITMVTGCWKCINSIWLDFLFSFTAWDKLTFTPPYKHSHVDNTQTTYPGTQLQVSFQNGKSLLFFNNTGFPTSCPIHQIFRSITSPRRYCILVDQFPHHIAKKLLLFQQKNSSNFIFFCSNIQRHTDTQPPAHTPKYTKYTKYTQTSPCWWDSH